MKKNLLLLLTAILLKSAIINAQVNIQDSLALVILYDSCHTSQFDYLESNWLKGPVSTWGGVLLDSGRVTSLILEGYEDEDGGYEVPLQGLLPEAIGNLKKLKTLKFAYCEVSGTVPASLFHLDKLETLDLSSISFDKPYADSFATLISLNTLDLSSVSVTGKIPSSIGSLKNLTSLTLSCSFSGTIPSSFGNLSKLRYLSLLGNGRLNGIPSSFDKLSNLTTLNLVNNNFTGNIPSCIFKLINLKNLDISFNEFSGTISDSIGNLINLKYLILQGNKFSGELPESIGNLVHLQYFDAEENQITGVPESIKKLRALYQLILSSNNLSNMPSSFAALKYFANVPDVFLESNQLNFDFIQQAANQRDTGDFVYARQAELVLHSQGSVLSVYAGGTLAKNTYHWYKNKVLVATVEGDSSYSISGAGKYYVTVTNKIATELTLYSDTVSVSAFANIEDLKSLPENSSSISLFPNPVKDILNFSLADNSGKAVVLIYDNNGKIILQNEQTIFAGNNITINTSKLAKGSYYIHVLINGKEFTKQFIKE